MGIFIIFNVTGKHDQSSSACFYSSQFLSLINGYWLDFRLLVFIFVDLYFHFFYRLLYEWSRHINVTILAIS